MLAAKHNTLKPVVANYSTRKKDSKIACNEWSNGYLLDDNITILNKILAVDLG